MIDSHTHLASFKYKEGTSNEQLGEGLYLDLLKYIQDNGLEYVVLLSLDPYVVYGRWVGLDKDVLEASYSDDRILPFTQDPKYKDSYGVGELKLPNLSCDSVPRVSNIFKEAIKKDKPLLVHLEQRQDRKVTSFNNLGCIYDIPDLVTRYPKLKLILHGPGLWKYFGMKIIEKVVEYPNVFYDVSGGTALYVLRKNMEYSRGFMVKYCSKVVYGTDFPCLDGYSGYSKFGIDKQHISLLGDNKIDPRMSLNLSDDVKDMIVERNIKNLLNI